MLVVFLLLTVVAGPVAAAVCTLLLGMLLYLATIAYAVLVALHNKDRQ